MFNSMMQAIIEIVEVNLSVDRNRRLSIIGTRKPLIAKLHRAIEGIWLTVNNEGESIIGTSVVAAGAKSSERKDAVVTASILMEVRPSVHRKGVGGIIRTM